MTEATDYSQWHWACIVRELVRLCPDLLDHRYANVHCIRRDVMGEECFRGSFYYQSNRLMTFCIDHHSGNTQAMAIVAEMKERTKKLIT